MKISVLFLILALTTACGTQQQRTTSLAEPSQIVVRSQRLVGSTVLVGESIQKLITKGDLTPFKMGVLGVNNSDTENLQAVTINVDPGNHRLRVVRDGQTILDQNLYLGQGQVREVRAP